MPPSHTLPPSQSFHVVDLQHAGTTLTVQWRSAPEAHARPIDAQRSLLWYRQTLGAAR